MNRVKLIKSYGISEAKFSVNESLYNKYGKEYSFILQNYYSFSGLDWFCVVTASVV